MRFCYLDESGVPEIHAGTSHFVLLGLSVSGESWKEKDTEITRIKRRFGLAETEIHTAWIARRYTEQERIPGFEGMNGPSRMAAVKAIRDAYLIKIGATKGIKATKTIRKDYEKSAAYTHLTMTERIELLKQLGDAVASWPDCRLFAECIDKRAFNGVEPRTPPVEEAFTQVVSRFHRFLEAQDPPEHGLIVQDHNETNAARLTQLMRKFHADGTRWTEQIRLIVETPLFVDSQLTSIVQLADLCAYAIRRFCENGETDLFNRLLPVFHAHSGRLVGIRHYTGGNGCRCIVCQRH